MKPTQNTPVTLSKSEILAVLQETLRNRRSVLARQVKYKMISKRQMDHSISCLERAIKIVEES